MEKIEKLVEEVREKKTDKEVLYAFLKDFIGSKERKYASFLSGHGLERGDLKSVIWLGIEYAVETYSKEKGCRFLTWASRCVRFKVLDECKAMDITNTGYAVSSEEDEELSLEEVTGDREAFEEFEKAEAGIDGARAIALLRELSEEERKIIVLIHIKGFSLEKASKIMNISRTKGAITQRRALRKLRSYFLP